MQIDLRTPISQKKQRSGWGQWRTVFKYRCGNGHEVGVYANSFIGPNPEPSKGAIMCPKCEWEEHQRHALKAVP